MERKRRFRGRQLQLRLWELRSPVDGPTYGILATPETAISRALTR